MRTTAAMPMRLEPQGGEVLDRTRTLTFTWNGVPHLGYEGDTIASALAAAGTRVFSRSLKYHAPRGLLTADFHDPGCIVQVDDEPNVRGAHRRVTAGMDVRAQNAWPSLRFDLKGANRFVGRWLSAGFYYKTFMRPRWLWPTYEAVLRRFSPGGHPPRDAPPPGRCGQRYAHPDVVVAGGGPAGMATAVAAADAGARVLLVDDGHELGGHLRWGDDRDRSRLVELRTAVGATEAIDAWTDSVVIGRYDDDQIAVVARDRAGGGERLLKVRAEVLVVAVGLLERPFVFAGNALPGVMLSSAVRRLINLYAVKPGQRAVVLTANATGDAAVTDLRRVGVEVARVVDARDGVDIVRARGRRAVRGVECADGAVVDCDLLVTAVGWTAPSTLLDMAGASSVYDDGAARFLPSALPEHVLATGGIAGDGTLDELLTHARAAGREAARRAALRARRRRAANPRRDSQPTESDVDTGSTPVALPELETAAHPALFRGSTHGTVDYCEDVSSADLETAVREGYDTPELAKRYTTATMGPTQGKLEVINTAAVVGESTGRSVAEVGTTTWRPPYVPVTLGALAAGRHEPVRRSPMQPWHERRGARPLIAGRWIRPDHYGDPAGEARHVRDAVGIIDVTPLGKFELYGPDVPALLELVYVNRWRELGVGAVRYGVMCADDGVVLDDGVTGRLAGDRYLMTTTSSGAATVGEWLERWLQVERPDLRVHVLPVTTGYASVNVAGPRSRELVARLVEDVDLSPEGFGYMRVRTGRLAGVDGCVIWRIGFTGELSYELHVPSSFGLHVWETLLDEGTDLGVRAFGIEAQRILRLEKGHLIVGQDTDGLTQGYGAGLGWAIKLDKDDFAGKPELVGQRSRDDHLRLVSLQPHDGDLVPAEGSQIVAADGTSAGRITSSRMSPNLGRSICLGFVAPHLAAADTTLSVRLPDGRDVPARVMPQLAHLDPEGERLRA